ncbi:MAG: CDP-alcohol phosphatidyltransferase family protein [Byssovorax cruenta]
MKTMNQHTRINNIFLGPLERPALQWLAAHMPAWVTPDVCTIIGVLGALLAAVSYGFSNVSPAFLWLASLGFVVNWFGDSLDGTLARYRRIERPLYGYFVDHTTDMICQLMIGIGLGLSPYVSFNVASSMVLAYVMLSGLVFLRTYVAGEFKISYGGLGPTESRVVAVFLNTAMYFFGVQRLTFFQVAINIYDVAVAGIGLLLFWFFITTALHETRRLAKLGK